MLLARQLSDVAFDSMVFYVSELQVLGFFNVSSKSSAKNSDGLEHR